MNKGTILILVGIIIVIFSLGIAYYMLTQSVNEITNNAISDTIAPHASKQYSENLTGNMQYYLLVNATASHYNISFKITDPEGNVIKSGHVPVSNSTVTISFKTTASGKYTLSFTNNGNTTVSFGFIITSHDVINSLLASVGAMGVCGVGVIIILVGLVMAIRQKT